MADRIILGITGRYGAGKTEAANLLVRKGFVLVEMADILKEKMKEVGITVNDANVRKFIVDIRAAEGDDVIAVEATRRIKANYAPLVVVSGIRMIEELRYFIKNLKGFETIAIYADETVRFERIQKRGRADDHKTKDDFLSYQKEIEDGKFHIEQVIKAADHTIRNTGNVSDLDKELDKLLEAIRSRGALDMNRV